MMEVAARMCLDCQEIQGRFDVPVILTTVYDERFHSSHRPEGTEVAGIIATTRHEIACPTKRCCLEATPRDSLTTKIWSTHGSTLPDSPLRDPGGIFPSDGLPVMHVHLSCVVLARGTMKGTQLCWSAGVFSRTLKPRECGTSTRPHGGEAAPLHEGKRGRTRWRPVVEYVYQAPQWREYLTGPLARWFPFWRFLLTLPSGGSL
jgi:hypothetical protein